MFNFYILGWVKVYITPVKWSVANATCISDKATLLIIRDEAFLNDVVNVVNPIGKLLYVAIRVLKLTEHKIVLYVKCILKVKNTFYIQWRL